ncbi:hypothetical protein [Ramlibacter humi]|uniref:hypothetical protein n=1 Tax=Ramlibacter humi TaxID=2530451 RepID=UPI00197D31D8|nr:hypothetical protein [Ramlibacter humi]
MLQIATGRLFTREPGLSNDLRGTVYTNAVFPYGMNVVPVATGRLLPPSSSRPGVKAVAYEFVEHIELEPDGTRGVLVSSTALPYTLDFATVCSFALNCICSPDYVLVQRLTSNQPGVVTGWPPGRFLKRTFDADIYLQPSDVEFLQAFVTKLIGLPRLKFLGVMRAIRTYVTALHRVADDLELAYTLIVASVESMAQEFDGHQAEWHSLEDRKRVAMDAALEGSPPEIARRVRDALLSIEHVALAKRFREFTLAYTQPSFFRGEATGVENPAGRYDIEDCLREAYTLRSKYVHSLKPLPHMLTVGHLPGEVVREDNKQYFTVAGLTRLMRHVITSFVMQHETLEREAYDYRLERHGIGLYPLAPQYWVGAAQGDITGAGKDKLQGFLQQLTSVMLREPGAALTDMRDVLNAANEFIPGIRRELRRPYLALMVLWNAHVHETASVQPRAAVTSLIEEELAAPSSEALIAHCLTQQQPPWTLIEHQECLEAYFRRRSRSGLRSTRLIEAAMALDLSERFRGEGSLDAFRRWVSLAVEIEPGNARLSQMELNLDAQAAVSWTSVLLPPPEEPQVAADAATAQAPQEPQVVEATAEALRARVGASAHQELDQPAEAARRGFAAWVAAKLRRLASQIEG